MQEDKPYPRYTKKFVEENFKAGDMIRFPMGSGMNHFGMYIGNNMLIETTYADKDMLLDTTHPDVRNYHPA